MEGFYGWRLDDEIDSKALVAPLGGKQIGENLTDRAML